MKDIIYLNWNGAVRVNKGCTNNRTSVQNDSDDDKKGVLFMDVFENVYSRAREKLKNTNMQTLVGSIEDSILYQVSRNWIRKYLSTPKVNTSRTKQ